ncbi:hypothetical protein BGZ46_009416 [Entomortierella lignicola]|nr:hypothetical protein BGZ46_009416 [Entomortierella lignicola]
MAHNSSHLHIDIPQPTPLQPIPSDKNSTTASGSLGHFQSKEESSFSSTKNGSQYLASPSSATSLSSIVTPLPNKMQECSVAEPSVLTPHPQRDAKKRLCEYEFPAPASKVGTMYQSPYSNHPFNHLRQQRLQDNQAQRSYVDKYASYTSSSQALGQSRQIDGSAPSMIKKENSAFQNTPSTNNGDDAVSPPPPPYLSSNHEVSPLDRRPSPSSLGHNTIIAPGSLAWNKRKSLPPPLSLTRPATSLSPTRSAKELKRRSLPVTPSAGAPQWPSAMTLTLAAVTRPKLARTVLPRAIPILYHGDTKSPLATSTPTAIFTPRTSHLLSEKSGNENLYSCNTLEYEQSAVKNNSRSGTHHEFMQRVRAAWSRRDIYSNNSNSINNQEQSFPSFWKDAKQHRMHWVFSSLCILAAGSTLSIYLIAPALLIWAAAFPGVLTVLLGAQYAGYRWRRHKHRKAQSQRRALPSASQSPMRAASAALNTSCSMTITATPAINPMGKHARRPSQSSMHKSMSSVSSISSLGTHLPSPPNTLRSQYQHQYFRSNASLTIGSPVRFSDGYNIQQHTISSGTLPEYRQSSGSLHSQRSITSQKSLQKNRSRTIQHQGSISSIVSSETVSSTSTSSELELADSDPSFAGTGRARFGSGLNEMVALPEELESSDLLTSLDSPNTMLPPPSPAYISKKCEEIVSDEGETLSEKVRSTMSLVDGEELPEISSVGNLVSEIALDFETIQY